MDIFQGSSIAESPLWKGLETVSWQPSLREEGKDSNEIQWTCNSPFFIVVTWGDLVLVGGEGEGGWDIMYTSTHDQIWSWEEHIDGLAYHIRDKTTHRPTIYGKWPLMCRHLKIGRVLFSLYPTIYGKRPLIWSHIKIGTVLFSPHLTIYGKLPLIRRHVKIGRVLFSLVTWVPPKRMMCHRL